MAAATSVGLGMPGLPVALLPGAVGAQSNEELRRNVLEVTVERVIANLTRLPAAAGEPTEPRPGEVIFRGDFEAVNRHFYENEWGDGLPVVPPTREKIEAFLAFADRDPHEVLSILPPDNRAATVWSVAVNGVMAGCRPEYMPILVALIEAMADPRYGVEHSGNTPGGETLIILNGPIIKQLGFNYTQGALRDGFMPNTSVGRFWRLYLRNVAGFLPHQNDKATFGNTWRVVLAENEDVLARIGWEPNSVEMGFSPGDNTVTIARYTGSSALSSVSGSTAAEVLPILADGVLKQTMWTIVFTVGLTMGTLRPLLVLSPILAEMIAKAGMSKRDVKRYLYDHARVPAWQFERQLRVWSQKSIWNLAEEAQLGHIPKVFHESDDPNRMVPLVFRPEDFMLAVSGDVLRNNAHVFAHNGVLGYPVGKQIRLPESWERRVAVPGK